MARYWILGNGCVQITYLILLCRECRHNPYITNMTLFYGPLCLTLIYMIPALFYLSLSKLTKSRDRVFVVWGCATSVLVSLFCLIPGYV
jgi:hypothetical protein